MRKQLIVVGVFALAALVAGGFYTLLRDHVAESPSAPEILNDKPPAAGALTARRSPQVVEVAAVTPESTAASAAAMLPPEPTPADRAAKIADLQREQTPESAYRLFQLLQACQSLRDVQVHRMTLKPDDEAQARDAQFEAENRNACAGIDQALISRRLEYLEQAAEGGYPGAAFAMFDHGPQGDRKALVERPNDPVVVEWKGRLLRLLDVAAKNGDIGAMGLLAELYGAQADRPAEQRIAPADAATAVRYRAAVFAIRKAQGRAVASEDEQRRAYETLGPGLAPAQLTAAIDDGRRFADACCLGK